MEAKEYKVLDVKPWNGEEHPQYGKKFSISVEGYGEPLDITAKKYPVKGGVEFGVIEQYKTKAGVVRSKFTRKSREDAPQEAPAAQTVSTPSKPDEAYWQSKNDHIKAQWAIGQAIKWCEIRATATNMQDGETEGITGSYIEKRAKQLYAMVDRVAGSTSVAEEQPKSGYEKAKEVAAHIAEKAEDEEIKSLLENEDQLKPIDTSDIPF